MILREPAGWERREGKSAELLVRARTWGRRGAIRLQDSPHISFSNV